jgi:hypothetical protein
MEFEWRRNQGRTLDLPEDAGGVRGAYNHHVETTCTDQEEKLSSLGTTQRRRAGAEGGEHEDACGGEYAMKCVLPLPRMRLHCGSSSLGL